MSSINRELAMMIRIAINDEAIWLSNNFETLFEEFKEHFQTTLQSTPDDLLKNLNTLFNIEQELICHFRSINALISLNRRNHNDFRHEFMRLRHANKMQAGLPREFKQSTTLTKTLKRLASRLEDVRINCQHDMKVLSSRLTLSQS